MGLNLSLPKAAELKPRIVVIGVGGAGGNAVNNMVNSGLQGVEFVVANTDAQALAFSKADRRIQIGGGITQGLGAGMRPEVGEQSAVDSIDEIREQLEGAHMLFIAAGMGGGTGTGAAPVIADAAREMGILTVAIVTKPFQFEGMRRMTIAEAGLERLYDSVDTLITIPNQNLFRIATEQTTMSDAFAMADEVLNSGVRGITDLMVVPGIINLDFADVRTIMDEMGKAMMGTGEATGERRAIEAAESAISNPLLDDVSLKGARGVLINITGGKDLTLYEVEEAASLVRGQVDEDANIIVGSALDSELDGIVRVSVVATGVTQGDNYVKKPAVEAASEVYIPEIAEELDMEIEGFDAITLDTPYDEISREPAYMRDPVADPFADGASENYASRGENVRHETSTQDYTHADAGRDEYAASLTSRTAREAYDAAPETPKVEMQNVVKSPFRLFAKKKPAPVATKPPMPKQRKTGDLFAEPMEDELDIPAFLRRGNTRA